MCFNAIPFKFILQLNIPEVTQFFWVPCDLADLPITSIQILPLIFPALFFATHPYWPASLKVTLEMTKVLLLDNCVPLLVQVTFGSGSPLSIHFNCNVKWNNTGIESLLRAASSLGRAREKEKYKHHICSIVKWYICVQLAQFKKYHHADEMMTYMFCIGIQ